MLEEPTRYTCTFDYEKDGIEYRANIKGWVEPPQKSTMPFVKKSTLCNGIADLICITVGGIVRGEWVEMKDLELLVDRGCYYVRVDENLYPVTILIDTDIKNQGVFSDRMYKGTDL